MGSFSETFSTIFDPADIHGVRGAAASKRAANAQIQGIREGNALQRDMFNAGAGLSEFQRGIGNQALNQLAGLYGMEGGYNPAGTVRFDANGQLFTTPAGAAPERSGAPDYSAFFESPDYRFALEQGEQGIARNQAARGNLFSGGAGKELSRFNQGLATQQFGNYTNNLARLAGIGANSTNQLGGQLQNTGNALATGLRDTGDARASGYLGGYQSQQQGFGNAVGIGATVASFFCDRRLKTNIKKIGERGGVPWYSFDYIWGESSEGPMADEVEAIRPDLVSVGPNGFKMVNLEAL